MNLLCRIFGHKFWEEGWTYGGLEKRPLDYCERCFLTKEGLLGRM